MLDAFLIMLRNVLLFVVLAIPGYILVKGKVIKETESGVLSKLLTYVGMPFLILSSTLNISFSSEFTAKILIVGLIGIAFTLAFFFLSPLAVKKESEAKKQGMIRFCMFFSNNGFLGIPLAKAVFGDSPVVTYLIVLNIITNVLMFTLGVYLISGDKRAISIKKALLSPVLIAFIVGVILNFADVTKEVPEVGTYSSHFSNIVTPISMTILGIKMAGVRFRKICSNLRMYFVSAVKLIVMPVIGVGLMLFLKLFFSINADMVTGFFIAFAMPTAGLASTFSDHYNGDTENAVAFTLGSTLFSVLTIPILYWALCLLL